MSYFVIRDPDYYGDVATVWNYHRREWCWDVDGEYTTADGFAYSSHEAALHRASVLSDKAKGVRAVDRPGLQQARSED